MSDFWHNYCGPFSTPDINPKYTVSKKRTLILFIILNFFLRLPTYIFHLVLQSGCIRHCGRQRLHPDLRVYPDRSVWCRFKHMYNNGTISGWLRGSVRNGKRGVIHELIIFVKIVLKQIIQYTQSTCTSVSNATDLIYLISLSTSFISSETDSMKFDKTNNEFSNKYQI